MIIMCLELRKTLEYKSEAILNHGLMSLFNWSLDSSINGTSSSSPIFEDGSDSL